jgi:hypothetical protein
MNVALVVRIKLYMVLKERYANMPEVKVLAHVLENFWLDTHLRLF